MNDHAAGLQTVEAKRYLLQSSTAAATAASVAATNAAAAASSASSAGMCGTLHCDAALRAHAPSRYAGVALGPLAF